MSKYRITLTKDQLRIIRVSLEEYFRLRMGQDMDFCDAMAALNSDSYSDGPEHERVFDSYISRRNHMRELMQAFFRIAFEPYGYLEKKTDDMLIAEDIWDQIRVAQKISRYGKALHVSDEPLPEIEVIE